MRPFYSVITMKKLQVSAGIIRNAAGEIFITRRAADVHMAGKLEFPGGKVEDNETPEQALVRELAEEVGITAQSYRLFDKQAQQFADRHITLWFWLVEKWAGKPWGKEGQAGCWMSQQTLVTEEFPPTNQPVIRKLQQGSF